jgi:hypothetical protein
MRSWSAVVVACALALPAWADLAPRDVSSCRDREKGAACRTDEGEPGVCEPASCSRNDYSQGVPPRHVSYECLKCRKQGLPEAPSPAPAAAPVSAAPGTPSPEPKGRGCASVESSLVALGALALRALRRRHSSDGPSRRHR